MPSHRQLEGEAKCQLVRWMPLSKAILTTFSDGTLRVLDPYERKELTRVEAHEKKFMFTFNREKTLLLTASIDFSAKLWDLENLECLKTCVQIRGPRPPSFPLLLLLLVVAVVFVLSPPRPWGGGGGGSVALVHTSRARPAPPESFSSASAERRMPVVAVVVAASALSFATRSPLPVFAHRSPSPARAAAPPGRSRSPPLACVRRLTDRRTDGHGGGGAVCAATRRTGRSTRRSSRR